MKALKFKRNIPRYAAAKIAGNIKPGSGASFGPIDLVHEDAPKSPGKDWVRVRPRLSGIWTNSEHSHHSRHRLCSYETKF